METLESLRLQIAGYEAKLVSLRARLASEEAKANEQGTQLSPPRSLTSDEYERYGRQMIVPGFGLQGMAPRSAALEKARG